MRGILSRALSIFGGDHEGDHRPWPRTGGLTRHSTRPRPPVPNSALDRMLVLAATGESVRSDGGTCSRVTVLAVDVVQPSTKLDPELTQD